MGAEAYDVQGHFVGRVREFFIEPADQPNRVSHFLLSRGRFQPLLAKYNQVGAVAPGTLRLNCSERDLTLYTPNESWLAVRKDLLDQQIIDTQGRKVVRVNDVDLAEQKTNGNVELRLTQVDVGLPGAVRRLLQGVVAPGFIRKLQNPLPQKTIRWEFVNLIEPDPLRRVKLRITHDKLESMHPADLADIMEELSPAERQAIIASLDEESAAEALAELDSRLTSQIVEKMAPEKAADIIEEMDPDNAADVLAGLSPEVSQDVIDELHGEEARDVEALLNFDAHSAGGMMTTDFVYVGETANRAEVVEWVRGREEINAEQLDTIFVIDGNAKFSGDVAVGRLLLAGDDEPLAQLKSEPLVSIAPDAKEKEVFALFDKYNLRTLAVVDASGRPIGAITVDDVITRLRASL
jgi:CBS domain-containing protein/sporulation protein YlmC with PRC-barrel domain